MWNNKDIVRFLCFAEAPRPRAPVACAAVEGSLTAHYESLTKANSCTFPSRLRLTSGRTSHTVERNSYSSDVFETHRSTSQATAKKKSPIDFKFNNNSRSLQVFESQHYLDILPISGMIATERVLAF